MSVTYFLTLVFHNIFQTDTAVILKFGIQIVIGKDDSFPQNAK